MKKIAVNTVKTFLDEHPVKEVCRVSIPVEDSLFVVEVQTELNTNEKSTFINRVLSGCFDARDNYRPEYVMPMIDATIVQMCTNLPVISLRGEKSDDGESLMDIDAMSRLYALLAKHVDDDEVKAKMANLAWQMKELCFEAIEWKRNKILAQKSNASVEALNEVADAAFAIRTVATKFREFLDQNSFNQLTEYAGKLAGATNGLDDGGIVGALISSYKDN